MNYYIIVPLGAFFIIFIALLIIKNSKDEKDYEDFSNNDFPKKPEEEIDTN